VASGQLGLISRSYSESEFRAKRERVENLVLVDWHFDYRGSGFRRDMRRSDSAVALAVTLHDGTFDLVECLSMVSTGLLTLVLHRQRWGGLDL